jgi:arylsulfatase A-like enzyme
VQPVRHTPSPTPSQQPPSRRLNIVLILTDDQRWDTLWAMPNVERLLAAHGVTFRNAFVTTSLCCPSRASILTGLYSRHTGVYTDSPPLGGAPRFRDQSTIATWLKAQGYSTGLVGKYLNAYNLIPRHIPPGWDDWNAISSNFPALHYYKYTINENGRFVHYGSASSDYSTTVLTGLALRFIRRATSPFFLELCPIAPHTPSIPAPNDRGLFRTTPLPRRPDFNEADVSDKPWGPFVHPLYPRRRDAARTGWQRQLASLQAVDRGVARIVDTLAARGQLDNTVFLYTSDNGVMYGEHRLFEKIWPYEESIRVPLVVRVPWATSGWTDSRLVANIDLAPTIAELAGTAPPSRVDGLSLVPLLHRQAASWRKALVIEFLGTGGVLPPPYEGLRTQRYAYIEYRNGWRELYDLRADPFQLSNRAGSPSMRAIQTGLAAQLHSLLRA